MPGTPIARKLNLRLYLEGQRVPIQQISIAGSVNSHVQATIQIPPSPLVTKIKPRTLVHVLVKQNDDSSFKLLFEGEYISHQDLEGSKSKFFVMSCVGLTHFWDTTYQFFIDRATPAAYGNVELASFVSGSSQEAGDAVSSIAIFLPRETFAGYVEQSLIRNGNNIHQAMLDVIFMMGNCAGATNGNMEVPRINSQLEKAFVNLRLGERVFVLPDENLKELLSLKNAEQLLKQLVGAIPDFSTVAGLLNLFLGHVYYDWVPMVSPSFTQRLGSPGTTESVGADHFRPADFSDEGSSDPRPTTSAAVGRTQTGRSLTSRFVMRDVIFKPKTHFLPAPACNLIFPNMYDNFIASRNFLQEPTRMRVRVQPIPSDQIDRGLNTMSYYAPPEINQALASEAITSAVNLRVPITTDIATGATTVPGATILPPDTLVKRQENLIVQQSFSGEIDETITGIIPGFEEMGFAEYAQAVKRGDGAGAGGAIATDIAPSLENEASGEDTLKFQEKSKDNNTLIDGTFAKDLHVYFVNVAQYKLDLSRAAARSISALTGPYNENLALGFPAVVFSRTAIYAGEIVTLNHVIVRGQASTTVTLGYVRELSLLPGISIAFRHELAVLESSLVELALSRSVSLSGFKAIVTNNFRAAGIRKSAARIDLLVDGFDPVDRLPATPRWLSENYRSGTIEGRVYHPFLGPNMDSMLGVAGLPPAASNQVIAANLIFIRYIMSNNKLGYVNDIVSRPIATGAQAMGEFLGFSSPSNSVPGRTGRVSRESLTGSMTLGATIGTSKNHASETITDPFVPVIQSRVQAVRRYVNLLAARESKAFKG